MAIADNISANSYYEQHSHNDTDSLVPTAATDAGKLFSIHFLNASMFCSRPGKFFTSVLAETEPPGCNTVPVPHRSPRQEIIVTELAEEILRNHFVPQIGVIRRGIAPKCPNAVYHECPVAAQTRYFF